MKRSLASADSSYSKFVDDIKDTIRQQKLAEQALQAYRKAVDKLAARIAETEQLLDSQTGPAAGGKGQSQLLQATKQMQETQMSFNLQYLQLQSQMQHENRSYTAISNIMKTKHDTVKNSISNIR